MGLGVCEESFIALLPPSLCQLVLRSVWFCCCKKMFLHQTMFNFTRCKTKLQTANFQTVEWSMVNRFRKRCVSYSIAVPDHKQASSVFYSKDNLLYLEYVISASVSIELMCLKDALCLVCPEDIPPGAPVLHEVHFKL